MSYRDIRNFTEMLRALGYPTLISMENFRQPNFPLVADLLIWFAKRFDPDVDLPSSYDTEDERVNLIRNAAQFMAIKANIKFNTKRLYQADGFAVKELLKVATLLYDALKVNDLDHLDDYDDVNLKEFDISDKLHDLKQSRQLASEITSTGATLFDLLTKEVELKVARNVSSSKQYEVSEVESGIKKAIDGIKEEILETKQLIDNVSATEASLDAKIERRKIEIDRYEKRLQTLKKVKPAFLEEFNTLEAELEKLFIQYSVRLRCLNQLEKAAAEAEKAHIEKQRVITKIPENVAILDEEGEEDEQKVEIDDENDSQIQRQERPRARTGRLRSERPTTNIFGGKKPENDSLSGSSLDLSDSETDIFLDKDESELQHSDDEDSFGFEISNVNRKKNFEDEKSGRKTVNKIQDNSDDDF
ncbi:clusterin-associated protein 1 [Onthophagus taurus]|uniref:clusterin-associated protein 1 n=1 Tax=Onthophagus taurus TaxID=166361 RepID=UPI000C20BEC1|nr:clusterin-associated protein 1 [Onthophagus taurus]